MIKLSKRFSKLRSARVLLAAGLVVALGFAAGWSQPKSANDEILPSFNLKSGQLVTINQAQMGKGEMALAMNGEDYVIDYAFQSNRSKDFRLFVQQQDGQLVEQVAPPVSTIRGSLRGVKGSRVVGCITKGGCCAKIEFPTGSSCYIEPVNKKNNNPAFAGVHVVYTKDEVIARDGICGTKADTEEAQLNQATAPSVTADGALEECRLAIDTDFAYFSIFGSTEAALAQIELVINVMNDQYESQVGIRHTISTATIRAVDSELYVSTDAGELLDELRLNYLPPTGFDGALCHLFTGKELDEDTIGVAYIGKVCSQSRGFGLSQDITPLSDMTDLVAHELGHNWNQLHCTCTSNTMNPFITGANSFSSTETIPSLIRYRDTLTGCLTEVTPPANDDWENKTLISKTDFSVTGSNKDGTTEGDEQDLLEVGSSVWWSFKAIQDGTITVDTFGSNFDTQLYAYELVPDGGLAGLELLAENDDFDFENEELQSEITFNVTVGTTYEVRVGGFRSSDSISDGSEGAISLNGSFVGDPFVLGDANQNGSVSFLDIASFIAVLSGDEYQIESDIDGNGVVDFEDVGPFITILRGF